MIGISNDNQISQQQYKTSCLGQNKMSTTAALKAHHQHHNHSAVAAASFQPNKSQNNTTAMKMSSLAADLCKAAAKPLETAVVVNSIIYSKPSFCSIVVDIGGSATATTAASATSTSKATTTTVPTAAAAGGKVEVTKDKMAEKEKNRTPQSTWSDKNSFVPPFANEGFFPMAALAAPITAQDAHVYMMCTTMNGSINHHISEFCDNLISMGLFDKMTDNHEHDDDSLIEFAYDDEDEGPFNQNEIEEEEDDEDDEDDNDIDVDETDDDDAECEDDDDFCLFTGEDVVDFIKPCPIAKATNEYCDKKKKVRFNTKPEVHVMHAWNYAYRAARKGHWEMYARDRERFKMRINRVANILNPILEPEHRLKVYENRFAILHVVKKETPLVLAEVEEPKGKPKPQIPHPIPRKTKRQKRERKEKRRRRMRMFRF
uniref:Uncharacterized protein n=1 Tax=Stomoxys calcitrans TaxID=35570 RepID=A0A1I8NP93_STOCA